MLKSFTVLGLAGLVALAASACGSSSSREGFGDGTTPAADGTGTTPAPVGTIGGKPAGENPAADECQKMDIVFVVDDSGSME